MRAKVRVGLVGAGYVASRHLAALRDLPFVDVVVICDLDRQRAAALAAEFGIPHVVESLSEAAAIQPEVIHILTPPHSHCALTLQALEMNCHVFVEKPMAETTEECDRMIGKARERGLVLSVNHSLLFEPAVERALGFIDRGCLGDLLSFTYFRGSDYPAYAGGPPSPVYTQGSYPFRDLGIHAVYLMERIAGTIEKLDVAFRGTARDPMLRFDEWRVNAACSRCPATAVLSWNMQPLQNEFWVHGARGILHANLFLQTCDLYRTYAGPKQLGFLLNGMRHGAAALFQAPFRFFKQALTGKLRASPGIYNSVVAFHRALWEQRPAPVSADLGRQAAAWVCEAAREADAQKLREDAERWQKPEPARILVTGANGFLGSALTRELLKRGERPRVLLRKSSSIGAPTDGLSTVIGNLGDPDAVDRAVEGVEVVYHVGAAMRGSAHEFAAGTVWGTRNIVETCLRHGVKRLIYVSSVGVLDVVGHPQGTPVTETSNIEPNPELRGLYTQTKLQAEQTVLAAVRERGLPATVIRPGQIFGPGAEQQAPSGTISIAGAWIVAGNGKRNLPLIFVDDCVAGLLAAESSSDALGKVIHLADSTPVTQNEYIERCRPMLRSKRVARVPVAALLFLGWLCDRIAPRIHRSLPLSVYRVRALRPLFPVNISAAVDALDWKPPIGTIAGLEITFGKGRPTSPGSGAIAERPDVPEREFARSGM